MLLTIVLIIVSVFAMIVCVCNRVSSSELEAAIAEGATTVQSLSAHTGCGTQCGRCISTVRQMLDEAENTHDIPTLTSPSISQLISA